MGPDFRSVEELQKPQLDILAAGILITVNLESIAVDLETQSSKNMNYVMRSLDFVALIRYLSAVRVAEKPYIQPLAHMRRM